MGPRDRHHPERARAFSAEGHVVEIFDEVGERRAKVVLTPDTIVDVVATEDSEVHLGDRVVVQGTITIDCIRVKAEGMTPAAR